MHGENDYLSCLHLFPIEDKIMVSYGGMESKEFLISQNDHFVDYSYCPIGEDPDGILKEKYTQQQKDWGQYKEYGPGRHPYIITLFDGCDIPDECSSVPEMPTEEELTKELLASFILPEYPQNGVYGYLEFIQTDTYKQWQMKNIEKIQNRCHFMHSIEAVEHLLKRKLDSK